MWIRNGMILTPDGTLRPGHIRLHENRIASVCFPDEPNNTENDGVIDADGAIVSPGLIDIHIHGAMGADVSDGTVEALDTIAGWLVQNGVTSFLASTMTVSEESLLTSCRAVCRHMEPRRTHCTSCDGSLLPQAILRGVRLEGPFLSAARVGAQNPDYLRLPDPAFLRRLSKACGNAVRIVDVAPELPGASDLIRSLAGSPIRVSLGHTAAAYDQAMAGFRAGAAHVTHLFNGMNPLHHREPGLIGAAVDRAREKNSDLTVDLICDGVHVHPAAVRLAFDLMGPERICMISDGIRACGMPNGDYELGGLLIRVTDGVARLAPDSPAEDPASRPLAGGASSLLRCVQQAVAMGIPAPAALTAATKNPARAAGLTTVGTIEAGKEADLILLDPETMTLKQVILQGKLL